MRPIGSNTKQRVASALVLGAVLGTALMIGPWAFTVITLAVGIAILYELFVFMLAGSSKLGNFQSASIVFFGLFSMLYFSRSALDLQSFFVGQALFFNILLAGQIFGSRLKRSFFAPFERPLFSWILGLPFLFALLSFTLILDLPNWEAMVFGLMLLNFLTDIGAWLVGRKLGRRPFFPAISPNKTLEGALGGVLFSVGITTIYWNAAIGDLSLWHIPVFLGITLCSELGDLVQSKVKRVCGVKDSSQLIPGHGGVYDRFDSLLFTAPVFAYVFVVRA